MSSPYQLLISEVVWNEAKRTLRTLILVDSFLAQRLPTEADHTTRAKATAGDHYGVDEQTTTPDFTDLAAEIVSAFVTKNSVRPADLLNLIVDIHKALSTTHSGTVVPEPEPLMRAVNPKKSAQPDYIVCLEDGKKFQVTEAAPEHSLPNVAGAVPREVGFAARLPNGGPELCPGSLCTRQEDGAWAGTTGQIARVEASASEHD
jgi:hypothetical protein